MRHSFRFVIVAPVIATMACMSARSANAQWSAYRYEIQRLGLYGPEFTGSTGYQYSDSDWINDAHWVTGLSRRIVGASTGNGWNTWIYDPHTGLTVQTGLTAAAHTGTTGIQSGQNDFLNDIGFVAGFSKLIRGQNIDNGQNTWVYNPHLGGTVQTGFTGLFHTASTGSQYSVNQFQNDAGQVAGYSRRFPPGAEWYHGQNSWIYNPATNTTLLTGLTDLDHLGYNGEQKSENNFQNNAGQVAGYSQRFSSLLQENGQNTWVYDAAAGTTVQTGLTGPAHTGSFDFQFSANTHQNEAGYIAGYSSRVADQRTNMGYNSWVYDPTAGVSVQVGLTDEAHTGSAGVQTDSNVGLLNTGQLVGFSFRYLDVSTQNGRDAWIYDPSAGTTTQVGLTGPSYTGSAGYQYSAFTRYDEEGELAGYSDRVTGVSTDGGRTAWLYNLDTGEMVTPGLTDAEYVGSEGYQFSWLRSRDNQGRWLGSSKRIKDVNTDNGETAWTYTPETGTTAYPGLSEPAHTGSGGYRVSSVSYVNEAGQATGISHRIAGASTNNGYNTWFYDPSTGLTVQIGLAESAHTGSQGFQWSTPRFLSKAGYVVGTSVRIVGVNNQSGGSNAWVYNPFTGATTSLGFTDAAHTQSDGYQGTTLVAMNDAGQVIGYSIRRRSLGGSGQDAWYYDLTTSTTYLPTLGVPGAVRGSESYSQPRALTDDGIMLGTYRFYLSNGGYQERMFFYRPDLGFTDIGELVNGGLAAAGWSVLSASDFNSPTLDWIIGNGVYHTGIDSNQSLFVLSRVPATICPADFNVVNGVTVQDLFDFLSAWLANSPAADVNHINGVTVQDIFDFLTAWLAGC